MIGTEKIKEKIIEDARARAAQIADQARRDAQDILESASKEANLKIAEIKKTADSEGLEVYRRMMAVAGLEGRKEILRTKQELIDTVFKKAMEGICRLPDDEYQKLLEKMAIEAFSAGSGEIMLSASDRNRIDGNFIGNINAKLKELGIEGSLILSGDTINTAGGFVIRLGDMEINSTFEILFDMLRTELQNDVVKILFG